MVTDRMKILNKMSFFKGLYLGLLATLLSFFLLVFVFTLTLESTLLKAQFMIDQSQTLDISVAASELLTDQMSLDETIVKAINRSTVELEPWVRRQLNRIIFSCYDYWQGKTDRLKFTLTLDTFKTDLVDNLEKMYSQFPPPDYLALSQSEREGFLFRIKQEAMDILPSTLEITESDLGEEIMSSFDRIRTVVTFINNAFWWSLVIALLIVLLWIVLFREVKSLMFYLGIVLTIDGVLSLLISLIFQNAIFPGLYPQNLIPELQVWIPGVIKNALFPAQVTGAVLLSAGILALAGTFWVERKRKRAF
jgi:hypothetical protein